MHNRSNASSRSNMNSIQPRGALVDPQTYGMLLWQSKLQEKLVQEQKEKRQRELDEQQRRIRERHLNHSGTKQQPVVPPISKTLLEIPPQMFPGPAPFIINPPQNSPASPRLFQSSSETTSPPAMCNGPTPPTAVSSPGGLEPPMFPHINRIRTSVSCDNFRKPPLPPPPPPQKNLLGNIVSFQQLGGAGSPRRSPSGKLLTVLRGDPEIRYHQKDTRGFDQTIRYLMDREKVLEYKKELDNQIDEKRKLKSRLGSGAVKEITRRGFIENGSDKINTDQREYRNPFGGGMVEPKRESKGVELAPLMRKFNSLPKLTGTGLSSTDVTRPFVHSPRNEFFHPVEANEVAETLQSQLREKEWIERRHQEKEKRETERHFQTWDSLWGRPGAGAPMKTLSHAVSFGNLHQQPSTGFNRVNLFRALHMTHQQPSRPK